MAIRLFIAIRLLIAIRLFMAIRLSNEQQQYYQYSSEPQRTTTDIYSV